MSLEEFLEAAFPTPPGDNTIDYLCHHLSPTQMCRVIHALRFNAADAREEEDQAPYRELEQRIFKNLDQSVGQEEAQRCLAMTAKEDAS